MSEPNELLLTIQAGAEQAAAVGRECVRVGPFLATFHPTTDMIWLNHVVPAAGGDRRVDFEQLTQLRRLYRERDRVLRFEYIEALWPDLAAELERFGLALQARLPFMICEPAGFTPTYAPDVRIQPLSAESDEADLAAFVMVGRKAFGQAQTSAEPHEIAELRDALSQGTRLCALAKVGPTPVGIGTILNLSGELAGVGTLPELRGRGVAASVCSHLLTTHFGAGGTVAWLSAGNDTAVGVYQRVGFRHAGIQLNYMDTPQAT